MLEMVPPFPKRVVGHLAIQNSALVATITTVDLPSSLFWQTIDPVALAPVLLVWVEYPEVKTWELVLVEVVVLVLVVLTLKMLMRLSDKW